MREESGKRSLSTPEVSSGQEVRLSVCLLPSGSSARMRRCLGSLRPLQAEVLIVDPFRSASTAALAARMGARVIVREWQEDFSALRNAALEEATGDWVLWMSGDEWLTPESASLILGAMRDSRVAGWQILVRSRYGAGETGECFLRRSVRLFHRIPGVRFGHPVCETVEPSLKQMAAPVAVLPGAQVQRQEVRYCRMPLADPRVRVRLLGRELSANPDDIGQLFNLGSEFYSAGDFRAAQAHLERASELIRPGDPNGAVVFSLLAVCLREAGEPAEGVAAAERAEEMGFRSAELSFARAWAHMGEGQFSEAAFYFEDSIRLGHCAPAGVCYTDPTISQFRGAMGIALALMGAGQAQDALPWAQTAVRGCPTRPETHVLLACVHHLRGELKQALKALETALELNPDHPDALGLAASLYQENGQPEKALTLVERLLAAAPDCADLVLRHASALVDLGKRREAYKEAKRALALDPHSAPVQVDAGRIFATCTDYKAALECMEQAIRLSPADPNAYLNAGDVLQKVGAYDTAVDLYTLALELDPGNAAAHVALGNALMKCGRLEAAVHSWERALQLRPDLKELRLNLLSAREVLARAA